MEAAELTGETLTYIDIDPENDEILLTTQSGRRIKFHHRQDCCESVRIVGTDGEWRSLIGKPLVEVKHDAVNADDEGSDGSATRTTLTFRVDDATVISRWFGNSNGYYSERVDIEEITEVMQMPFSHPRWEYLFRVPKCHRWFRDKDSRRIAVCDDSGKLPDETDDGVLWLVPNQIIETYMDILLVDDDGNGSLLGGTNYSEAAELVRHGLLAWKEVEPLKPKEEFPVIYGSPQAFNTEVKRFYVPGFTLRDKCPKCGKVTEDDMAQNYLSYPSANEEIDKHLYCEECNVDWPVKVVLSIELYLASDCVDVGDEPPEPAEVILSSGIEFVEIPQLNERELATVLAALRHWQRGSQSHFDGPPPLTLTEIDVLCERLNCGGTNA